MITKSDITSFSKDFNKKENLKISKNAITSTTLHNIVLNRDFSQNEHEVFSKKIDTKVSVSNQKNTGRCWIFAFLNVLRLKMIEKYDLDDDFEFSQTYLFFFDKLEKSNYFLQNIVNTKEKTYDSRVVNELLKTPIGDGGMSNMFINLVNKYGLIPKSNMRESYQSINSEKLNELINNRLREAAYKIRESNGSKKYINQTLGEIYNILVIFLGEPPKRITWEYYKQGGGTESNSKKTKKKKQDEKKPSKKKNKYRVVRSITPLEFYKNRVPINVNDFVFLMNYPLQKYNNIYNILLSNNVVGGIQSLLINIDIGKLKKIAKESIDNDDAVWFSADVHKYASNKLGVLDKKAFNYKNTVGFDITLDKKLQLKYEIAEPNHAMIFKGYSKNQNGKITKWFVENSWGTSTKKTGHFTMSDEWFDEYVYEIVVFKKHVPSDILSIKKKKPVLLQPWDPIHKYLTIN